MKRRIVNLDRSRDSHPAASPRRTGSISKRLGVLALVLLVGCVIVGLSIQDQEKVSIQDQKKVSIHGQMEPKIQQYFFTPFAGTVRFAEGIEKHQRIHEGEVLLRLEAQDPTATNRQIETAAREIELQKDAKLTKETQLRMREEQKRTRERELAEHDTKVALKRKDFEQRKVELGPIFTNAENTVADIEMQIETHLGNREKEIQRLQIGIESAQTTHDSKLKDFETDQRLYQANAISKERLDGSENAFKLAQVELRSAKYNLEIQTVKLESDLVALQANLTKAQYDLSNQKFKLDMVGLELDEFDLESQILRERIEHEIVSLARSIELARADLTAVTTRVAVAEAALAYEETRAIAEGREYRAPFDGYVLDLPVENGHEVQPGQALIKIGGSELEFVGLVESRHLWSIEEGQLVEIDFERGEGRASLRGKVVEVTDDVRIEGARKCYVIRVEIAAPENVGSAHLLDSGTRGAGHVLTRE